MPSLKAIRKRIGSVKNTQKITRAMKMVAAARLRRAQEAIVAARPYSDALERVAADLAAAVGSDGHPLLTARPEKRAQYIVMTSDRGLAGSFNAALIRQVEKSYLPAQLGHIGTVDLHIVGRKGRDYFRRLDANIVNYIEAPTGETALDFSRELAQSAVHDYIEEKTDAVYITYNQFKAPGSQEVVIKKLLPVASFQEPGLGPVPYDFVYEPSEKDVLEHVLPLYVQNRLHRAALESIASELGSRMAAMDAATRNAGEMIAKLTLQYNRARQAAITKELLEIIAGAESLKG